MGAVSKRVKRVSLQEKARTYGLQYVGRGGFHITGVPKRDLTPAEVLVMNSKYLDLCLSTGLYKIGSNEQEGDE